VISRRILLRIWKLDDTLLSIAFILSWIEFFLTWISASNGAGRHTDTLSDNQRQRLAILDYIQGGVYRLEIALIKLSICVFYLNIFRRRLHRNIIFGCIVFVIISFLVVEGFFLFKCTPVSLAWDISATRGSCLDPRPDLLISTSSSILADLWIMATVIPLLLSLQLHYHQKVATLIIVSLGWVAIAASLVRNIYFTSVLANIDPDPAWYSVEVQILSFIEADVGIICASVAGVQPILTRIRRKPPVPTVAASKHCIVVIEDSEASGNALPAYEVSVQGGSESGIIGSRGH
jgi:hypothetical protein